MHGCHAAREKDARNCFQPFAKPVCCHESDLATCTHQSSQQEWMMSLRKPAAKEIRPLIIQHAKSRE
eukprot:761469-Hanusia_phi.AAC.5